jgi:hypothetical protein
MTRRITERRHGTYIYEALKLHNGHRAVIEPTLSGMALQCMDCERQVLEAGLNRRWRGEYESSGPQHPLT